jgi:hypothetical protein
MWHPHAFDRIRTSVPALQAQVERAGYAMACAYSSSDEFEAAVIRARRSAGHYGPRRWRPYAIYAGVITGALAICFSMF